MTNAALTSYIKVKKEQISQCDVSAELVPSCCVPATWAAKTFDFDGTSVDYPASVLLPYVCQEVSLQSEAGCIRL